MATILCLETTTTNCSVTLSVNGSVIAFLEDNGRQYSHAERLHVYIEQILRQEGIKETDLDAIAVSKGPGSYTGLRIGVSAAKGLCFALDIPLLSTSTLEALARKLNQVEGFVVSMLDARRMEVYSAVYTSRFDQIRETRAEILSETSFSEYLEQGKVHFIGNGVEKFKAICDHKNAVYWEEILPSSQEMGGMAEIKFNTNDFEDLAYFEPYYLKDFMVG